MLILLFALQEPPPQETPEVVVTAKPLTPEPLFDTPYKTDVLTGEEIQGRRMSRSFPEALKEIPGVTVQKTGHGQGSPFIRGFTGYRNLLLVDGIRLNSVVQRQGPNQYWSLLDPYTIDRIEVVRGPASVIYGSDALGGTVAAYTREPDFEEGAHGHGRTVLRYSSGEDSWTARQEGWGGADDFAAMAGATWRDYGNIRGGTHVGRQPNTGYEAWDGDLKTVWRAEPNLKLTAAFQRTELVDAPRTHRTNRAVSWHGTTVGTDRRLDIDNRRELAYLQAHWTEADSFFDELQASVSYQRLMERESRTRGNGTRDRRSFDDDTLGVWTRLRSETDIGTLTYGVEWYRDFIDSDGRDVTAAGAVTRFQRGVVADDTTYDLFGAYLQDDVDVGDFTFTLGARLYYAAVDADQVDFNDADGLVLPSIDEDWLSAVGSARAVYHVADRWNLIGGVGQGYRAPSVEDMTSITLNLSGTLQIPAPDLDPERTTSGELGVRTEYDDWGAELFGFYTDMNDVIERVRVANPFFPTFGAATANQLDNFGDGNFYGLEFAAHVNPVEEVTLFGDVAWAFGETERIGGTGLKSLEPADKVNPLAGHVGVRWEPAESGWWVEAVVTMVGRQDRLSPSDLTDTQRIPPGGTPGFTIYTLRGGYRFDEHVAASASVENISDKDYRFHGSGQNEPGVNAVIGLELTY